MKKMSKNKIWHSKNKVPKLSSSPTLNNNTNNHNNRY